MSSGWTYGMRVSIKSSPSPLPSPLLSSSSTATATRDPTQAVRPATETAGLPTEHTKEQISDSEEGAAVVVVVVVVVVAVTSACLKKLGICGRMGLLGGRVGLVGLPWSILSGLGSSCCNSTGGRYSVRRVLMVADRSTGSPVEVSLGPKTWVKLYSKTL